MKQRLLISLLMLFVSVGFIAAKDGTLVLNVTEGEKIVVTAAGGNINYNSGGWNTSVTFTADKSKNYTVQVSGAVTGLTVNGKVSQCSLDAEAVTSLSFTGNGELTKLYLNKTPKMKTISAGGNKLTTVEGLPAEAVISGNQTVDASSVTGAANHINVLEKAEKAKLLAVLPKTGTTTVTSWAKYDESTKTYATSSEAKATSTAYPGDVAFVDAEGYYTSGVYKCTVTRGSASVTLEGIKITPALVKVTVQESPKNAWKEKMGGIEANGISVLDCSTDAAKASEHKAEGAITSYQVHQGDQIQVTATAQPNYVFDKFVFEKGGLNGDQPQSGSSMTKFTVKAKASSSDVTKQEEITLQAVFKGKPFTLNYTATVRDGNFSVQKVDADNKPLATLKPGATVEYGDRLLITATPSDKYYSSYQLNGAVPTAPNTTAEDFKKNDKAYVKVTGETNLSVSFLPNTIATKYSFVLVTGEGITNWDDLFASIEAGEQSVEIEDVAVSTAAKFSEDSPNFPADKDIQMVLQLTSEKKNSYVIRSVQLGAGQTLTLSEVEAGKYVTSFRAPEEGDAVFTITVTKRADVGVYVVKSDGSKEFVNNGQISEAQHYAYNGQNQPFRYVTDPANLTLDVVYAPAAQASTEGAYTSEAPINAGSYAVKYSRKADSQYAGLNLTQVTLKSRATDNNAVLVIDPAEVVIKTIPTVDVVKKTEGNATTYSYQIGTNGVATALGKNLTGKYELFSDEACETALEEVSDTQKSHTVYVRFTAMNGETPDSNYAQAVVQAVAKVDGKDMDRAKVTILQNSEVAGVKILSGSTELESGAEVVVGTKIRLRALVNNYATVKFVEVKEGATEQSASYKSDNIFETTDITVNGAMEFKVLLSDKLKEAYSMKLKGEAQAVVYTGEAQKFDASNHLTILKESQDVTESMKGNIYFKDEAGNVVKGNPVNVGKYAVCLDIPMDITNKLAAQTLEVKNAFQITPKSPKVTWPESATRIGKGQTLAAAQFKGGSADVEGTFSWVNPNEDELVSGQKYDVKFTPTDLNFKTVSTADEEYEGKGLAIVVSEEPVISIDANVQNGHFEVWSKDGLSQYLTGNEVTDGTEVIIKAIPNKDFEIESLIVDECGARRSVSNGATFKINGKSILVTGSFRVKETTGNFRVSVPDAPRGTIVSNSGDHVVTKGGSLSFTVSTLSADASKLVVKANGVTLRGSNGRYTVSNVQANTNVTISLPNPTALKVTIPKEIENKDHYLMGTVEVDGPSGKYYYGDELTLMAYPESGVKFSYWSHNHALTDKVITVTLTGDFETKAVFTGTPTGIEDIESARVYGSDGCVMVRGVANAEVTIVSMAGRVQTQQQISGDTRIDVPRGIYVVVLESGSDVKRVKVAVK